MEAKILRAARDILSDPARWLHGLAGWCACRADGTGCSVNAPDVARWDLQGAMYLAAQLCEAEPADLEAAEDAVARVVGVIEPASFSAFLRLAQWHGAPERTHADVLAALDRAIAEVGSVCDCMPPSGATGDGPDICPDCQRTVPGTSDG